MKNTISFLASALFLFSINAQTTHDVNSGNFYYSPQSITIDVGDSVHWINDNGFHNVNFDINTITGSSFNNPESFISTPTSNVDIYTHTFTIPGTYQYDCSVGSHAANGMVGTIIVTSSSTDISESSIVLDAFDAFFQERTNSIQFDLEVNHKTSDAVFSIFDIEGKLIEEHPVNLTFGQNKGSLSLSQSLSSGIYLLSLSIDGVSSTKKIAVN